jgi:hypothetical protein
MRPAGEAQADHFARGATLPAHSRDELLADEASFGEADGLFDDGGFGRQDGRVDIFTIKWDACFDLQGAHGATADGL